MSSEYLSVAVVSGKGGVGKTILASNLAWGCSRVAKTILVDLDFQNQGATGLFATHFRFTDANALAAIRETQDEDQSEFTSVADGLAFMPSVPLGLEWSHQQIVESVSSPTFRTKLSAFLDRLHREHGFQIVIMDCHGGVEGVSLAAFQTCEHTLMVTEADSVTFNGTLELLDFYQAGTKRASDESANPANDRPERSREDARTSGTIKFIVNRLPPKFRWKDLETIYGRLLSQELGRFSADASIFAYIPVEDSISESFGEYPFHIQLAPKSVFARKIHWMVYRLLDGRFEFPTKKSPFKKFEKERYEKKVEREIVSLENRNIQTILTSFAWTSVVFAFAMVGYFVALIAVLQGGAVLGDEAAIDRLLTNPFFMAAVAVLTVPVLIYSVRSSFGLMFYYRRKHKFQRAMFKVTSPSLGFWQRLSLAKLLVLRLGTSIIPGLIALYVLAILVVVVAALLSLVL